jgi:hypothetical protein
MLREQAKPVNAIDAAITQALELRDPAPLAPIRQAIDSTTLTFLEEMLAGQNEVGPWERLARGLDASFLDASALLAYGRLISLARTESLTEWERRAPYYTRMIEIERRLGMGWTATAHERVVNRLRGRNNAGGQGMMELEGDDLYVLSAHSDPAEFARLTGALADHPLRHDPLRDPSFTKVNALGPPPPEAAATDECSFLVMDSDGRPVLLVEADALGDRYVGCRETAILLTRLVGSHPRMEEAEELAVRQLRVVLAWSGCTYAMVERRRSEQLPQPMRAWINQGFATSIELTSAWVDLSETEEVIERSYREAHRQSLRWGRKNIRIERTDLPDPRLIAEYEYVHYAGRRIPAVTGEKLSLFLSMGRMTLYVGYFEDKPVVTLLSSRHGHTTYYWASAKLPVGNKPIGHVVLHQAIMDAKAEGKRLFYFGLLDTIGNYGGKSKNIALYKSGFATRTEAITHYILKL